MRQLAGKVKSRKAFIQIKIAVVVGVLILGGLGYRLYWQQQTIQDFDKQIQLLPTSVPPEEKLKLEKERIVLESTLTSTLAQILTGGFFFITAYFSWGNLQVANAKQITERFTQAINQLGSEKIEVRLGGIYALERIAKDSPKDHWTIMEVLTAFVRERSPVSRLQKSNRKQTFLTNFLPSEPSQDTPPKIATDLQAALTVIGRRDLKKKEPHHRIDLSQTDLSGANLSFAYLSGANLSSTKLNGANFSFANFSGARNWTEAELAAAKLCKTILPEGCNLNPNRDCEVLGIC